MLLVPIKNTAERGITLETIINISGLVKRYKELTAVDNLSLSVQKGRILGLLGPNGSGKTTTIHCLLGLLAYDAGSIELFGEAMDSSKSHIKARIGVVFQEVGVFDELTVYENIDYFCGLYIQDKQKRRQMVKDAVDLVQLQDFVKFRPKKLSGGLYRRLNIACGIAHKPELIIFDEPTVAVDPQSRNHILEGIQKLNAEGATIIYTSHYMEEVDQICDEIVIIDQGRKIAEGTSDSLKASIQTQEKIRFTADPLSEAVISKLKALPGLLELKIDERTHNLSFEKGEGHIIRLVRTLQEEGVSYDALTSERPSLNDVFLELTGKALRD